MADSEPALLQETLPLCAIGEFRYTVDVAELGIDPLIANGLAQAGPICFLDFEATGLDSVTESLIEAGAVRLDPGEDRASVFNSFIHTEKPLTPFIRRLTGIHDDDLKEAPRIHSVATELDGFIGDAAVVAHNAAFESTWLATAVNPRFERHRFLDTLDLLSVVYPDSRNMKLDTFCRMHLDRCERHRALDDALDTLRVVAAIIDESRRGAPALGNALWALERFNPTSPWRERIAALIPPPSARPRDLRAGGEAPKIIKTGAATLPQVGFARDEICGRLADAEAGASVLPDFVPRQEQAILAGYAFDAFNGTGGKTVRVCEAGTGIGKTLAYLAAAIPFARKTGEQVVIATSTKLLQTQLMEKDIPAAAKLMGYDDLRFAAVKGRANYICGARLEGFLDREQPMLGSDDARSLAIAGAFARNAVRGEIDRVPTVLHQMNPMLERHLREISSADSTECSRQTCETLRGDCVFRSARRAVEGAEIIVTNHDLLLRWPNDYPELRHLIVDEVHELAEKADEAYGMRANANEIAHRLGAMVTGREAVYRAALEPEAIDAAHRALELLAELGKEARSVAGAGQSKQFYRDDLPMPLDGPGPDWSELVILCDELCIALDRVSRALAAIADDDEHADAAGAANALREAAEVLGAPFPRPPSHLVARFSGLGRNNPASWQLVVTPVSPAGDFDNYVLSNVETFFGTSATIGVGGDALGSVSGLELDQRAAGRFAVSPPLESPFNYAENLHLFFVSDPMNADRLIDRTTKAIAATARVLEGKTLGLFTARTRMDAVAEQLEPALSAQGITIIAPATGGVDPHDLVRDFMENDHAVLLGARAFWQGVDIPGDACQALVIEKLPFAPPGDPLSERRQQIIEENGGNGFIHYALPRMLLRLKQMAGRLIRTPQDYGVIVIVESRSNKRYFDRVYDALPPGAAHSLLPLSDLEAGVADYFRRRKQ